MKETLLKLIFSFSDWLQLRYPSEELENLSQELIAERLSRFYQELKQDDGKDYSRSAHVAIRAGINRYLTSETVGKTFSIISDPIFKTANKSLNAKLKKIKESGTSKVKHHASIQAEDIQKCYESGVFGGDSPISLLRVNWFNINLFFCRRGRENQRKLTKNSFVFKRDANQVEYVEMAEQEKTKNHPGGISDKADEADPKMFSTGETHCPVQYLKKLIQVLNPGEEALFQRPKRKFCASDEIWFDRAPLGVNSLGNMMKEISTAAKLSQVYTNHCIRATSVTLLDRAGIPVHRIMQVSGHRNEGSVKVYCERQTLQQQKQCSEILAAPVATNPTTSLATQQVQQIEQRNTNEITYQNTFATTSSPKFVDFGNARFENCNFAFTYNVSKKSD